MRLIFCGECAMKFIDENGEPTEMRWAKFGPLDGDGDEVLITSTEPHPALHLVEREWKMVPCDGCEVEVVVSKSSYWFLEGHTDMRVKSD